MLTKSLSIAIAYLLVHTSLIAQWYQQSFPGTGYLWKVSFADENTGWIVGQDAVYGTSDGGLSWAVQNTPGGASFALKAIDENTAVYALYNEGIRRTTDGGLTWAMVDSLAVYYTDFEFVTTETGYAAGGTAPDAHSLLRKTTDGGTTWNTVSIIPQDDNGEFEGISFVSEMLGWGITYGGTIYKTTDGGASWSISDSSGVPSNMRDIDFIDGNMGWAVGGISGTMHLWRTIDGGSSWIKEDQTGSSVREISMLDAEVGWFAGTNNGPPWIAGTDDGGVSWETQDLVPGLFDGFESLSMVNENTGWAVGCCGRVYKTTNGGITNVKGEPGLPLKSSLEQNYPNPFNAQTRISYAVGSLQSVVLNVYDVLGREIATLVNEQQDAGSHSVVWDAAGLPSGVYYYRLHAGSYVETKKLVLLR